MFGMAETQFWQFKRFTMQHESTSFCSMEDKKCAQWFEEVIVFQEIDDIHHIFEVVLPSSS